jgi:hypothetical protein
MYLVTAILAILSYRETLWIPAPVIVEGKNPKEWRKILDQIHQRPQTLSLVGLEMQLVTAIEKHQHTNDRKYKLLLAGYVFLIAGILFTAITGCLVLRGLAPVWHSPSRLKRCFPLFMCGADCVRLGRCQ